MKFDESVLREADIRGVYPDQLNSEFAMRLGKVFGTYVRKNKAEYCVVGHDNRFGGPDLTKNLIEGILSTGVSVIYIGLVTTPMLNYASRRLGVDYGVCVTASHNPKQDNGFKLFGKYALHCSHEDLDYIYNALKDPDFKFRKGDGDLKHIDVSDAYAQAVAESTIPGKKNLKVVVDPGNGTGSVIVKKVYDRLPYKVTYINDKSDPSFPNHHPDPNVKENLKQLQAAVKRNKADIGLAYDGDADRIGVVDDKGHIVDSDVMMALMVGPILRDYPDKPILIDVKCTKALQDEIEKHHGTFIEVTPSSARQEDQMFFDDLAFGGGYSNHIFFHDRHPGYDDGIYAGLRFHEMLSYSKYPLSDMLKGLKSYYNTDEIKVATTDEKKWKIVDSIKKYCDNNGYEYSTIDGIKAQLKNGWALVRASNTGPNLTLRFEATTSARLAAIKKEFLGMVNMLNK